jgi:hypothetical protein
MDGYIPFIQCLVFHCPGVSLSSSQDPALRISAHLRSSKIRRAVESLSPDLDDLGRLILYDVGFSRF